MSAVRAGAAARWPGALAVVHPFPSALNAVVVLALAVLAGGDPAVAAGLAAGMLGLQFCIGASNDLLDVRLDAATKPAKPIPAGRISRAGALLVAIVAGGGGLLLAALNGPVVLALAAGMLAAGMAYNLALKRGPFSWLPYAVALPLLPLYAWWGAAAELPPRPELLLPLAALAGPALQLANGVVDVERDRSAGTRGPAVVLGRRRSLWVMVGLQIAIHGLAWISLAGPAALAPLPLAMIGCAGLLVTAGLALSASPNERRRERGWQAQAASIGLLATGWLTAAAQSG